MLLWLMNDMKIFSHHSYFFIVFLKFVKGWRCVVKRKHRHSCCFFIEGPDNFFLYFIFASTSWMRNDFLVLS